MFRHSQTVSRRNIVWSGLLGLAGAVPARAAVAKEAESASGRPVDDFGIVDVRKQGAAADGIANDLAAILRAAVAARTGSHDGIGRKSTGEIRLPPGRYRIAGVLDLAPLGGVLGLTISGSGAATEILFDGPAATIHCSGSRAITFRDLSFISKDGVDAEQNAFFVHQEGNPLRSWRFERCEFAAFYRCFMVTGNAMCSEFFFDKCQFSQCYYLMDNNNDQAVNWNFVNCNWENNELDTIKDKRNAAAFWLKRGSFVKWTGGSMIFFGRLVYYNLTASGSVQRPTHLVSFDGVRIELEDEGGGHVPFVDRVDRNYVAGTNQPTTNFRDCTIVHRGRVPSNTTYARVWQNCSLAMTDCKGESGQVVGVLDSLTSTHSASVTLRNTKSIGYEEDTTARLHSHDQHHVTIVADNNSAGTQPMIDQRLCSLVAPATANPKYMYVRGPTGSLPYGGTTVALTPLPDHTMLLRLFVRRFGQAGHALTVELQSASGGATYARVALAAGPDRYAEDGIGAELGFEIPSGTALVLKFTGVAEVVKGVVGIEYL